MRLIDADAANVNYIPCYYGSNCRVEDVEEWLKDQPTIYAVPVVHGRWEWFEEWLPSTPEHPAECEDCGWRCGRCKNTLEDMVGGYWDDPCEKPKLKYCANCGTKMDGGNDAENH